MSRLGDDMDFPFEPTTGVLNDEPLVSGGVVVMAAAVPLDGEVKPALVFRFAKPLGGFYQPTLLVLDDDQAAKLPTLITAAVQRAIDAAKGASDASHQ